MEIIVLGWLSRYEFKFHTLKKTFPNGHLKFSFSVENNCQERKHLSIVDPCHNAISTQAVFIEYVWLSDGKLMCFCLKKKRRSELLSESTPSSWRFIFFLSNSDRHCLPAQQHKKNVMLQFQWLQATAMSVFPLCMVT